MNTSEERAIIEACSAELATQLSLDEAKVLVAALAFHVAAGEGIVAEIARLAGPNPGPVAARMKQLVEMGNGYHRTTRDGLRAALKTIRARKLAKKEAPDGR